MDSLTRRLFAAFKSASAFSSCAANCLSVSSIHWSSTRKSGRTEENAVAVFKYNDVSKVRLMRLSAIVAASAARIHTFLKGKARSQIDSLDFITSKILALGCDE